MTSHIAHAKLRGINRMTFDNQDELVKVARYYPEAQMILRIITDDSSSLCQFSSKYGAPLSTVRPLLALARELGVDVVGVSFHVGSGCADASAFRSACQDALKVFNIAKEEFNFDFHVLDIGGGFQGTDDVKPTLAEVASFLIPELSKFPPETEFCAEPGRYFATRSHTLVTRIHSRRVICNPETGEPIKALYYIGDGVYHSFNCIFFDHQHPLPCVLPPLDNNNFDLVKKIPGTVFGPTCDSLDCICTDYPMPLLNVGDWLYFRNMGSYTTCATTRFNGFPGTVACHYFWGPTFVENVMGEVVQGEFPGLPAVRHHPSFVPVPCRSPEPQQQQRKLECSEEINLLSSFSALQVVGSAMT
jgi:ornithine decarboxylase